MSQVRRGRSRRTGRRPRKDLSAQAYTAIKDLIRRYELKPEQKLTQSELARRVGVSLTPVREALRALEKEGYVTPVRNRGFYVSKITVKEAEDLFDIREALEVLSVQRAIERRDAGFLHGLDASLEDYKRVVTHALTRERIDIDQRFHLRIAQQADNESLHRMLTFVFERITLKRTVDGAPATRGLVAYEEHVALVEAIRHGEADRARELAARHVRNAKDAVRRQLHERASLLEL